MDAIVGKALEALATFAAERAGKQLERTEIVVRALDRLGIKPEKPPSDFEGVYVYSLIQYGAGRPPQALELFRQPEIRDAFRSSFERNDPSLLEAEGERFLEWNRVGDSVRDANIDPRREFALFTAAFHATVDATRDPAETRRDQQIAAILDRLSNTDLAAIRQALASQFDATRRREFVLAPSGGKLKVFISSRMEELRDLRSILQEALAERGFDAFLYETSSGSRPETIVEASLAEVEAADVYLGIFETTYGEVTIKEFERARDLKKPCFVYLRDRKVEREKRLQRFLDSAVLDPASGVSYDFFETATQLARKAAESIMGWLVRDYRVKSAQLHDAGTSREEQDRLRKELERLRALVRQDLPEGGAIDLLGANLDAWFRVSGYAAEAAETQTTGRYSRIINVPDRDRPSIRVLVHGVEGSAELAHLQTLRAEAEAKGVGEAWLISLMRKNPSVVKEVHEQDPTARPKLACYTFDELIDLGANFTGYFNWLENEIEDRGIDKRYIPLACAKAEFDPETNQRIGESVFEQDTDAYISQWLDDPSKEHISILGQFGTGKTWFALHYAWIALRKYLEAKKEGVKRPRLPVYIALRDHAKAVDVKNLFSEFFFSKQKIDIRNYSAFEEMNRMGRFLLIFDGFDEMADRVDREKVIEHFWKLAQVVAPRSKVILTSRTEHFPNDETSRKLLSAELQAATAGLKMTSPTFEVLELRQLNRDQIRRLLEGHGLSDDAIKRVMSDQELLDLASRPVMIDLITESLAEIERGEKIDISRIYLYATRRKMERDIASGRTFTSLADKFYFLCELSWSMLSQKKMALNYQNFPAEILRVFGSRLKGSDRDYFQYDMMGQTMLIRKDGDYAPAHRSLLEFWAACKLAAEMGILAADFTSVARQQSGIDPKAAPEDRTWSAHFTANPRAEPLGRFLPEPVEQLKKTLGAASLSPAIIDLMAPMLDLAAAPTVLQSLIERSVQDKDTASAIISANSLMLLNAFKPELLKDGKFVGARFHELFLKYAEMPRADFSGASFESCTLERVSLSRVVLSNTTWTRCQVTARDFHSADLRGAAFSGTEFDLAGNYGKAVMNREGLIAFLPEHDRIELFHSRNHERLCEFQVRFAESMAFVTPALLSVRPYFGAAGLWDVKELVEVVSLPWPDWLPDRHIEHVFPLGESGRAWLLGKEKLVLADWNQGKVETAHDIGEETGSVIAASPDGAQVAVGGKMLERWSGTDEFYYDKNQKPIALLAYSPSGLYLAAVTETDGSSGSPSAPVGAFILNTATRKITDWDFVRDTKLISFWSDTLLLAFTPSDLRIVDLNAGKDAVRLEHDYISISHSTLNSAGTALIYADGLMTLYVMDVRPFISVVSASEPLFPGDTGVNWDAIPADQNQWPEWWRAAKVPLTLPDVHVPNPRFGQAVTSFLADQRCERMDLTGVSGLDPAVRERFIQRGAIYKPGVIERLKKYIAS